VSTEAFQTPIFVSGPDKNGFNLGCRRNFLEIFGEDRRLWLLPTFTRYMTYTFHLQLIMKSFSVLLTYTDPATVEPFTDKKY